MKHNNLKRYTRNVALGIPKFIFKNIYRKPKLIIEVLIHPSKVLAETYFPELKRKGRLRILSDQILNILKYCAIDEYYYMYGLDVKRDIKNNEYVTYIEFMTERDRLNLSNPHNDSAILRNKLFFESVACSLSIPTPINVAYSDNGILYKLHQGSSNQINWEKLTELLSDCVIYIKPIDGECGTGIIKIKISHGNIYAKGKPITMSEIKTLCKNGRYIFQKEMIQHHEMSRIYPNSVNTIRMTTVRNPKTGEIEVLPPTLRIGAHGSYVDNFSKGGVIVAMDTETGKLAEWGFFKPMYGFKSKQHPDTKILFSSFQVPFYQEAKLKAKHFHSFLNLHSIGWDIAISEEGPVFIEGNDNWEINLPQTFVNPFKKEFNRLFLSK